MLNKLLAVLLTLTLSAAAAPLIPRAVENAASLADEHPLPGAPSVEQSLSMKTASNPQISPDGRWVAYVVGETNWEEDAFETEIWIANTQTGESYQLTNAKKSSNAPQWSPDGKRLAFGSDRDGRRQIYLISPAGGEAAPLTKHEIAVGAFEWSPDGKRLAFTAVEEESKAMKDRKKEYGEVEVIDGDYSYSHLWVVDVPAGMPGEPLKANRITQGANFTVQGFEWSPDSTRIAFSAPRTPNLDHSDTTDLFVVTVADKSTRRIVDTSGPDTNPLWSPDGTQIAFETAAGEKFYYYKNGRIAVIPAAGGTPRIIPTTFDEDPALLRWGPDGIYFSALEKMTAHLFRLDPATGKFSKLTAPGPNLWFAASFTADFKQAAFTGAAPNEFSEVYVSPLAPFAPRKLTRMADQYKDFKTAVREVVSWKSTDGATIDGVLIKPRDFDPKKKYPLLVVIHGGPTGVDRPTLFADRTYPVERFIARGALVFRPNYRGSAGYGEKFRSLNVRNLGVGDAWDVLSGVDYLIAQGFVDPERMGCMGWSQGGYISAYLTTTSTRFKAISVGAGISNWVTYYVNTDIHPFTRQYLQATPWDDPQIYAKTSPMTFIKQAKTPTLIQHGERDARVPIPNAFELFQGLQDVGVPVRFVMYKGFGHGINKPKEQRHVMEDNEAWFAKWIWQVITED